MKKCFVDTNIIIRYFVDSDQKLLSLFETYDEIYIPLPIIFETCFVLEKLYKIPRNKIFKEITNLLLEEKVISEDYVDEILAMYKVKKSLSVVDCYTLIHSKNLNLTLETFDKDLLKQVS